MKPLANTYLVISALSAILTCSSAQAVAKNGRAEQSQMLTSSKLMSYTTANSNLFVSYSTTKHSPLSSSQNSPLQLEQTKEKLNVGCSSKKKNELYELSAIFNDKLQMFLSYFDDQPTYATAKHEIPANLANRKTAI